MTHQIDQLADEYIHEEQAGPLRRNHGGLVDLQHLHGGRGAAVFGLLNLDADPAA